MVRIERTSAEDAEKLRQIGMQAFAEDTERYGASPPGIDLVENHREWIEKYHYYYTFALFVVVVNLCC